MNLTEQTKSEEYLFRGRVIRLRRDEVILPDGNEATREVIEHNGGVGVVPLTDDGEVLLVRQYRYPYKEELLEIPAGKRDSATEDPLACGIRELKEETGCSAARFVPLGKLYPSPGYCGEIIWMYAATGLSTGEQQPDDDEFLEVEHYPLDTVVDWVLSGKITDAKTQAAILKTKILKDRGEL
ncbi:MAG: NUDIX hydrolase [Clostridia bacterium]|nr:NUDIX hydrolase [Clostridia bacterium]